ncbi:prolyl oligopeptidase family serine peptidase [Sphaerisporangium sp. TRM90804]|uniref:alpha/beta hydrolase family protein n=1 Tax=Sphaerisporangium sp. TRM90804 TaxID=3031113 RepID=UPI002449C330|nr:prolyl oligopeptidase family serine peptidase [Sphaerisporangium sp. TRM90804]MDH2424104.1 prolyl oligopeptidase family serine peptidase [Sphaerisporangium sp. TRM90804]
MNGRGRLSVATGLMLMTLATVGSLLSPPAFDPPRLSHDQSFEHLPPQPAAEMRPVRHDAPIVSQEITVAVQGERLPATVRAPRTPGRHPAMVFVQGSGNGSRGEFTTQATWLARAGVVTLTYDKRTVGYDFRHRDFGLLADDALRMIETLQRRSDVDPVRTGLWGVSEGSWVIPIAAARSLDVGYAVLVSSPNVTPMRQVAWALNEQLERLHAPTGVRELLTKAMGGVGFDFLRYDSAPALRQVRQPVLALYGTTDPSIPFVESTQMLTSALDAAGNSDYTIRFLDGADHAMRVNGGAFARGYLDSLANWILGLPGTARPPSGAQIAGATPVQRYETADVPAAPWYTGTAILGLALTITTVAYVAAPVTERMLRLRGRDLGAPAAQLWPAIRRRLSRMLLTGVGLLAAVMAFIMLIVLFSVNQAGAWPAVLAGWLVVRVLAILILVQEITASVAVYHAIRDGWEPTRPQRVAVAGVLGTTGLLLVTGAYYGLFGIPW